MLSIAVGVFAVGMVAGARSLLATELYGGYAATRPADLVMGTRGYDDELLARLRRASGVAEVDGRSEATLRFLPPPRDDTAEAAAARGVPVARAADGGPPPAAWRDLVLVAHADPEDIRVGRPAPVAGAWPPGRGEVVLERASQAYAGARVGDRLRVDVGDGRHRELLVVGLLHDRGRVDAELEQRASGYVSRETMGWLGRSERLTELRVAAAGEDRTRADVESLAEDLRARLERAGIEPTWTAVRDPGSHPIQDIVDPLFLIFGVVGALAALLSGLLVSTTVSALLAQQVRQIGVMKAIGARRHQIGALYGGSVLLYGLLALLVALPLGAAGAWALTDYMAGLLNLDTPAPGLPARALWAQVAVALLVPLVAAAWPLAAGSRSTVRAALSDHGHGDRSYGGGRLDRALASLRGPSRPLLLSLRNTLRRTGRLALALLTLGMAGGIFVSVLTVRSSLLNTLDTILGYWSYDVRIGLENAERIDALQRWAGAVPGVRAAEAWSFADALRLRPDGSESERLLVVGVPAETELIRPRLREGRWLRPDDERAAVVNAELLREEPDAPGVGAPLRLDIDGRVSDWTIVGVLGDTRSDPRAYVNQEPFARLTGQVGRAGALRVAGEELGGAEAQLALGRSVRDRLAEAGVEVTSLRPMAETREGTERQFDILVALLLVMALILAVVGGLGQAGMMGINVLERRREIGIMRSLGATDGALIRMTVAEGLLVGLAGALLGLVLSLPLGRAFSHAVGVAFLDGPLDYRYSLGGLLLWFVLAGLIALAASLLPAWHATRIRVRDALHYE